MVLGWKHHTQGGPINNGDMAYVVPLFLYSVPLPENIGTFKHQIFQYSCTHSLLRLGILVFIAMPRQLQKMRQGYNQHIETNSPIGLCVNAKTRYGPL